MEASTCVATLTIGRIERRTADVLWQQTAVVMQQRAAAEAEQAPFRRR